MFSSFNAILPFSILEEEQNGFEKDYLGSWQSIGDSYGSRQVNELKVELIDRLYSKHIISEIF